MPFIKRETWERPKPCTSPEHNPPGHIVLPDGVHTWKCPACGAIQTFTVQKPMLTDAEHYGNPEQGELSCGCQIDGTKLIQMCNEHENLQYGEQIF